MINLRPLTAKHIFKIVKNDSKRIISNLSIAEVSDKEYCYDTLSKVSRSFALVIQDLPEDLKDAICIFYLVLRALDTIEDDMDLNEDLKQELLADFYVRCNDEKFALQNIGGKPEYVALMENYPKIARMFNNLSIDYQLIIKEITCKMAKGMLFFISKKIETKVDYDLYCHYVAGLVGQGLSKIFVASGLENEDLLYKMEMANSMGLFLQKTNITRDFHEDFIEDRFFWPKEIWGNYISTIQRLKNDYSNAKSIACLNSMIINALSHFLDCITYLKELQNTKIFRFCAIPQAMAVGTLSLIYNNPNALIESVKMSKQETMQVFTQLNTKQDFAKFTLTFLDRIQLKESDVTIEVVINQIKRDLHKLT